jgi:hypothetical protein
VSAARPRLAVAGGEQDDAPLLFVEAVPSSPSPSEPGTRRAVLRKSSPVAAEALRLGLTAAGNTATTFAVHLPPGFATGDLAASSTAGMYRAFVHDGRSIAAHADLEEVGGMAAAVGPQMAWAVAAYIVGQHFQVEISGKLDDLRDGLEALQQADLHGRYAQLASAHLLVQKALARAMDGVVDVATTLDLAHQDVLKVLGRQRQWLAEQESAAGRLQAGDHDATAFLEAFPGLLDGSFAENAALTAAVINVHRELLHVEGLVAAGLTNDPYSHYKAFLDDQAQAMVDLEGRLRSVVRVIGRLPFAPEERIFHWVNKNPSGSALQAQRAALAVEDALVSWLVDPLRSPNEVQVTAQVDGGLTLSLPA